MDRLKRFSLLLLLGLLMSGFFAGHAAAQERVFDRMGLLTEGQVAELQAQAERLTDKYSIEFVLITRPDNDGKTYVSDYADSFYMQMFNASGKANGITMTLDTSNREYAVNTFGRARELMTDNQAATIIDATRPDMRDSNFAGVFEKFMDMTGDIFDDSLYDEMQESGQIVDMVESMPMPDFTSDRWVYDEAGFFGSSGLFGGGGEGLVQQAAEALYNELGVAFYIVAVEGAMPGLLEDYGGKVVPVVASALTGETAVLTLIDAARGDVHSLTVGDLSIKTEDSAELLETALANGENRAQACEDYLQGTAQLVRKEKILASVEIPELVEGECVVDAADMLTDAEEAELAEHIEKLARGKQVLAIYAQLGDERLLREYFAIQEERGYGEGAHGTDPFLRNFYNRLVENTYIDYDTIVLIVSATNSNIYTDYGAYSSKLYPQEYYDLVEQTQIRIHDGQIMEGSMDYFTDFLGMANRILPDTDMVTEAPAMLGKALLAGFGISLVLTLILWLMHRATQGREPHRGKYVEDLRIDYTRDYFVSSHVTRTSRPKDDDSSSSSDTSTGGGSNSGGASGSY